MNPSGRTSRTYGKPPSSEEIALNSRETIVSLNCFTAYGEKALKGAINRGVDEADVGRDSSGLDVEPIVEQRLFVREGREMPALRRALTDTATRICCRFARIGENRRECVRS